MFRMPFGQRGALPPVDIRVLFFGLAIFLRSESEAKREWLAGVWIQSPDERKGRDLYGEKQCM